MSRNWGLPRKPDGAFRRARKTRPLATLAVSAVFGIIGAAVAVIGFAEARDLIETVYRGKRLVAAILAAGFGCWLYVWLARARFAAHFTGDADAFADLLRFYVRAGLTLIVLVAAAEFAHFIAGDIVSVLLLCACGGAGAAAAFQTVFAFVPDPRSDTRRNPAQRDRRER